MKKAIEFLIYITVIFFFTGVSYASDIFLEIKNNGVEIVSLSMTMPEIGEIDINDTAGNPHSINQQSVLNIINLADQQSFDFDISELTYYDSFGAFYLRCITLKEGEELCDNWQYKVNNEGPSVGMDQNILSGGETVTLYYGSDEEIETLPVEEPEPEPKPPTRGSSSSRYRISRKASESTDALPAIPISLVEEAPVTEILPENLPNVNQEKMKSTKPKKEIAKIKKPVIENTASVISSVEADAVIVEIPKKSWFRRLLDWIFSF